MRIGAALFRFTQYALAALAISLRSIRARRAGYLALLDTPRQ